MSSTNDSINKERNSANILSGTVRVFTSEALIVPTGLITTIFLTRMLGPDSYGIYGLAVGIVLWIEFSVSSVFSGTSIKFIGESDDWKPVATAVIKASLLISLLAMAALWLTSGYIADLLNAPKLAGYLKLLSIDIPIFVLSTEHRHVLIGIGRFRERAFTSAVRWISRLLLIVLLVAAGLSVEGAIIGIIGASILELAVGRYYARPPIFSSSGFKLSGLWRYVAPLFIFSMSMRLYEKMDLFFVKGLGGSARDAGLYTAAQNLSIIPGLFALSFAPLLLSTLAKTISTGDSESVLRYVRNSYRVILMFLPFAAMTAGCSYEIITLIFGTEYVDSAPVLSILIFGSIATVFISVNSSILTASGKPGIPLVMAVIIVPLAVIGYLLLVPARGMIGAALVFTAFAWAGAFLLLSVVYIIWRVYPPLGTVCRSLLISVVAYLAAVLWGTPGPMVLLKLSVIVVTIFALLWFTGEPEPNEAEYVRSIIDKSILRRNN